MAEQVAAVLGEGQAAGGALQQAGAEMLLQRGDLAGDGGLGGAEFAGDGGEGAGFGDADLDSEGGEQVHRGPMWWVYGSYDHRRHGFGG